MPKADVGETRMVKQVLLAQVPALVALVVLRTPDLEPALAVVDFSAEGQQVRRRLGSRSKAVQQHLALAVMLQGVVCLVKNPRPVYLAIQLQPQANRVEVSLVQVEEPASETPALAALVAQTLEVVFSGNKIRDRISQPLDLAVAQTQVLSVLGLDNKINRTSRILLATGQAAPSVLQNPAGYSEITQRQLHSSEVTKINSSRKRSRRIPLLLEGSVNNRTINLKLRPEGYLEELAARWVSHNLSRNRSQEDFSVAALRTQGQVCLVSKME